jgi:penicillin amidase
MRKSAALIGGFSALILGIGILYLATALPRFNGRVTASGIAAPVEILRDANGVPHILGHGAADVYFGLGFAQAQDRLWQMEFNRRLAAGRLAEILGPEALKTDRLFRTLGLWRHSAASVAALDPETRAALDAYTRGVNAYIDGHRGPWPPEFILLGTKPAHWRAADSVAIVEVMAVLLSGNMFQELERAALATRLSPEQLRQFDPPNPAGGTAIIGALGDLYRRFGLGGAASPLPPGGASNNWVVAGGRSVTGQPLLANDTHLPLTAPSLFYLAHLALPAGNAVGATLPGVPGIIVGRTDRIAWGFTTTNADVQDLYIEQTDPADPDRYRTPDGWARFDRRREVINVRDAAPETLIVRTSRHGPVLPPEMSAESGAPGAVLALRWTLYERPTRRSRRRSTCRRHATGRNSSRHSSLMSRRCRTSSTPTATAISASSPRRWCRCDGRTTN